MEKQDTKQATNHRYLNVRVSDKTFDLLAEYCEVAGQTKTVAVDRALQFYCKRQIDKLREA